MRNPGHIWRYLGTTVGTTITHGGAMGYKWAQIILDSAPVSNRVFPNQMRFYRYELIQFEFNLLYIVYRSITWFRSVTNRVSWNAAS